MNSALNILYVEDCEATVELFRLCINKYYPDTDITLDIASTVSDAIERFTIDKHVAVLIDWNLPDGDGTEVAQHIRQLHKTLPIIFLSAVFTEKHLAAAEQYSPMGCLTKDHSRTYIENIIRHIPTTK